MIPYGIGALIFAPLTRRISYRSALVISMFSYALSNVLCGATHSIKIFFLGSMAMGLAASGTIPLSLMVIGELFEKNIRGRLVGGFFSCAFVSSLVGNITSGVAPWRSLFFVPAAMAFLTVVGFLTLPIALLNRKHDESVNYLKILQASQVGYVFLYIFFISSLYHSVIRWYGVYLHDVYHLDKFAISIFFSLVAVAGAVGQNIGGQLTDKKGRLFTAYFGLIVLSLATMMLIGQYPLLVLGGVLALLTIGWTISHNGVSTTLTDFPDTQRPAIASLNSSVRFIGGGVGFFISSFFVQKSFGLTFFTIGFLMFTTSFFLRKILPQH